MGPGARGEPAAAACGAPECPSCGGPTAGGTPQSRAGSGPAKGAKGEHRISAPPKLILNPVFFSLNQRPIVLKKLNAALYTIDGYCLVFINFIF